MPLGWFNVWVTAVNPVPMGVITRDCHTLGGGTLWDPLGCAGWEYTDSHPLSVQQLRTGQQRGSPLWGMNLHTVCMRVHAHAWARTHAQRHSNIYVCTCTHATADYQDHRKWSQAWDSILGLDWKTLKKREKAESKTTYKNIDSRRPRLGSMCGVGMKELDRWQVWSDGVCLISIVSVQDTLYLSQHTALLLKTTFASLNYLHTLDNNLCVA